MQLVGDLVLPCNTFRMLVCLQFAKINESDFVYTLAFTNVDQLVPNMVTIYMTMSSWMSFDYQSTRTVMSGVICP